MRWLAILRLTALVACAALATSRFGLVLHELGGHGGAALALGGTVTEVRLFWFAGGWIRYDLPGAGAAAYLAVALGGMVVELLVGGAVWWRARGETLGARLVRGTGGALVVHAGWYAATGAWHGYGDGAQLYAALGAARAPVAIALGAATCAMVFAVARAVLATLAATIPGPRAARIGGVIAALLVAAGLHAALAAGELRVRRDATYRETMAQERDRAIARELAAWERAQAAAGVVVAAPQRDQQAAALAETHRVFPFAWVLAAALVLAALAGAARSRASPAAVEGVPGPVLARAAAAAATGVALVIVLGAVLAAALGM